MVTYYPYILKHYIGEGKIMERRKYIYWKDVDMWLGYLQEYPDYMTQGETLDELKDNLRDIYNEVISGNIPCVRRVDELEVA
jgi:predicted RNase H-like HicB family nuclease